MREVLGAMQMSAEMSASMNSLVRVFEVQETMLAMSQEMMKAGIIDEMASEAIDDALYAEDDEEAADAELEQVLTELNIEVAVRMDSAPSGQVAAASSSRTVGDKMLGALGVQ